MNLLITGATGALGSAVIETLLTKIPAQQIAALIRTEEKQSAFQSRGLQAHVGNYDDRISLQQAMNNIDTVLLISATDEGNRMQQHGNVIDAAKAAGVAHIAYTSRNLRNANTLANGLMLEHFATEDLIKKSGLHYTIFRNALYMDVIPLFVGKQVFETGIFQPAGEGEVAFALRKEMGEAIANVLANESVENKIYRFTGNEVYSFYDVAAVLSALSGKEVKYTPVQITAFDELMKKKGLPGAVIQKIINFNTDIKNGQEAEVTDDLETMLGRQPANLSEGLKILFNL